MKKVLIILFIAILIGACSSQVHTDEDSIGTTTIGISYTDNDQIQLSWEKIDDVTGYEIFRKDDQKSEYKKIKTIEDNTVLSYTDSEVQEGKTYIYKVRGYFQDGERTVFGDYSTDVEGMILDEVPVISKVISTSSSIELDWTKSQDSTCYAVYRKTEKGDFEKIADIDKEQTHYTDKDVQANKRYIYKIANITTAKTYYSQEEKSSVENIAAPTLLSISYYSKNNKNNVKITWESENDAVYSIMKKDKNGKYQVIGEQTATSETCSFYDKSVKENSDYSYTVRQIKKLSKVSYICGNYDKEGLTTLSKKAKVTVDATNLRAAISWDKIDNIDGYIILRKNKLDGNYKKIATVGSNVTTYTDVYKDTFTTKKEKKLLSAKTFLDASNSGIIYSVRGYKIKDNKISYSNYYEDGDFHLEAPAIVGVDKNSSGQVTIEWGTVNNAQKYYLYSGYKDNEGKMHWEKAASINHQSQIRMKESINVDSNHTYFTVKAVSQKNGEEVYSSYDKNFNIENRRFDKTNVLFFGDSITFGSPYKAESTRTVFSYPHRVQQLTGINYYNPSIPGSTYTYSNKDNRSRMIQIAKCLNEGRNVTKRDLTKKVNGGDMYVYQTDFVDNQINGQRFKDFDVVIFAAGTNDYLDDAVFGSIDSQNINEYNGAMNTIMSYIQEASQERVKNGKKPIKVVFINLFYSDRTYNYAQRTNRFVTQNKIGLTLTDYQNNINRLIRKYKADGVEVYQYANKTINENNCPYMTSDNLHMNKYAYTQIGNELTQFLLDNKVLD